MTPLYFKLLLEDTLDGLPLRSFCLEAHIKQVYDVFFFCEVGWVGGRTRDLWKDTKFLVIWALNLLFKIQIKDLLESLIMTVEDVIIGYYKRYKCSSIDLYVIDNSSLTNLKVWAQECRHYDFLTGFFSAISRQFM